MVSSPLTGRPRRAPVAIAIGGLMAVAAVAFAAASVIHFGTVIALGPITVDDPFPGAAIPEAVIAVVLAIGALSVLTRRPARWGIAVAATVFTLLLTLYGLTVTVGSARTGDIAYHVAVLLLSVGILGLLLLPAGRQGLSR
jgi:hypothetical protein